MIQTTGPSVTVEAIAAKRAELREIGLRAYIEAVEREAAIRLAMIDAEREARQSATRNLNLSPLAPGAPETAP